MQFEIYKELVEKYYQKDCREINFQNRILIPFLEGINNKKYDIVDSSTLYKRWTNINRDTFAGTHTPDILVIEDWELFNKEKKAPVLIIEVKSPTAKDRNHAMNEVNEYLTKSKVVVLTDCITWEIYNGNPEPLHLYLDSKKQFVCERTVPSTKKERLIDWIDISIADNDWVKLCNTLKSGIG